MSTTKQDVNVGLVAFIGIVGSMVLLILVVGVQAWFAYEKDVITYNRYDTSDNLDLERLKAEQYANIGDPIGNDTIYADEVVEPKRFRLDEVPVDYRLGVGSFRGYRFTGEDRQQLVVPIHLAMAAVVAERGGPLVSVEDMRAIDGEYVTLVNESYASPLILQDERASGTRLPATRPTNSETVAAAGS
jgi:hypothetical protein